MKLLITIMDPRLKQVISKAAVLAIEIGEVFQIKMKNRGKLKFIINIESVDDNTRSWPTMDICNQDRKAIAKIANHSICRN